MERILPSELVKLQHAEVLKFTEYIGKPVRFQVTPDREWIDGVLEGVDITDVMVKAGGFWMKPLWLNGVPKIVIKVL